MFDGIQMLEQEVEAFRNNILASQDFILSIDKMISAMKTQSESCSKSYEDVLAKLENYIELQKNESENQIEGLKKTNEDIINNVVDKLTLSQKEYLDKIAEFEFSLKKNQDELTTKHQEFIAKLEATNIDQIYSSVEDLKKSLNLKLCILFSGVGISIILTIVALLLK